MQYPRQELYDRAKQLESEVLVLQEDLKQLKKDFTYNKKSNLDGLPKDVVGLVGAAAKIAAKQDYEEKREKALAVFEVYEELERYND